MKVGNRSRLNYVIHSDYHKHLKAFSGYLKVYHQSIDRKEREIFFINSKVSLLKDKLFPYLEKRKIPDGIMQTLEYFLFEYSNASVTNRLKLVIMKHNDEDFRIAESKGKELTSFLKFSKVGTRSSLDSVINKEYRKCLKEFYSHLKVYHWNLFQKSEIEVLSITDEDRSDENSRLNPETKWCLTNASLLHASQNNCYKNEDPKSNRLSKRVFPGLIGWNEVREKNMNNYFFKVKVEPQLWREKNDYELALKDASSTPALSWHVTPKRPSSTTLMDIDQQDINKPTVKRKFEESSVEQKLKNLKITENFQTEIGDRKMDIEAERNSGAVEKYLKDQEVFERFFKAKRKSILTTERNPLQNDIKSTLEILSRCPMPAFDRYFQNETGENLRHDNKPCDTSYSSNDNDQLTIDPQLLQKCGIVLKKEIQRKLEIF